MMSRTGFKGKSDLKWNPHLAFSQKVWYKGGDRIVRILKNVYTFLKKEKGDLEMLYIME